MTPTTDAGRALLAGLTDDDPEARTLLSDIEPAILAIEAEARAELLARLADWLAGELGFPTDVTFEWAPPVSIDDMAAAYHRLDPSVPLEDWRIVVEDDWPPKAAQT